MKPKSGYLRLSISGEFDWSPFLSTGRIRIFDYQAWRSAFLPGLIFAFRDLEDAAKLHHLARGNADIRKRAVVPIGNDPVAHYDCRVRYIRAAMVKKAKRQGQGCRVARNAHVAVAVKTG